MCHTHSVPQDSDGLAQPKEASFLCVCVPGLGEVEQGYTEICLQGWATRIPVPDVHLVARQMAVDRSPFSTNQRGLM